MQAVCLKAKESCSSQHAHTAPLREQKMSQVMTAAQSVLPRRIAHKPAPQLRRTRYAGHTSLPTQKAFLVCAPQMFRSMDSKESCPQSQTAVQHRVHPTLGSLRKSQAVFYTSAFFQSDGVPPPAPARVTQTVGRLAPPI
jgi:hypothetical protein